MAAKALANIGGKATVDIFIKTLKDGDVTMRETAANYLVIWEISVQFLLL